MPTDTELLQRYANDQAQDAFAEFVRRNFGLVYSAALRRTCGRTDLAQEIAQKVFTDASRKAAALARHPAITAWLHQGTRFAAADALRAELRRKHLATSLASMNDYTPLHESSPDWEKLRPVLDQAMDELGELERELMLLRHFQGLSHAQVGERLGISENAARKRSDRALERLRKKLTRRGIPSTAAALGMLLSGLPLCAAPSGLAPVVTAAALATPPATGLAGLLAIAIMNKLTTPIIAAALTAGLTTIVWSATHSDLTPEIQKQLADYGSLKISTAEAAPPQNLASVAADYERDASAIADTLAAQRRGAATSAASGGQVSKEVSPHGYTNQGRATALDAVYTFAWACDVCDPDVLGAMVYMDEPTRARAAKVLSSMPDSIRANYGTPEAFYGMLLAAACIEAPPPSAELARHLMTLVELDQDHVATRRIGSSQNHHEYQRTTDGWKYILPGEAIDTMPQLLNSPTLAKLSRAK